MPNTIISPNMLLPVPVVGVDPGPQYAIDINSCLSLIDSHNHTIGSGVQLTPAALNINSDLSFNANNATFLRSVRFLSQGSPLALPADVGSLYESGVDLYYNDGNGNQIRLTQSGSIVGTSGSISGLIAPASASYNSGSSTFIWQSGVNIAANLDAGSIILRNLTLSSNGVTLAPPSSLPSSYTVTLPALPSVTSFLTIDSSGNMSTVSRQTGSTVGIGGIAISSSSGVYSALGIMTPTDVPGMTVTITTTGRPVRIYVASDGTSNISSFQVRASGGSIGMNVNIQNTTLSSSAGGMAKFGFITTLVSSTGPSSEGLDIVPAGTYTYTFQAWVDSGSVSTATINYCRLIAYEL